MSRTESRVWILSVLAAAGPAVLATSAVLTFSVLEVAGRMPLSLGRLNVAEAAGMGHAAEVLRLLRAGEDPTNIWPVRGEIISNSVTRVTALEAAIWSRQAELVQLLDRQGNIGDDQTRHHLLCLATDLAVEDIVEYLSQKDAMDCVPGEAREVVLARSREAEAGGASR